MEKTPTALPGCFEIQPRVFQDDRGRLVKHRHQQTFQDLGLTDSFGEAYWSVSQKGVLRGLHFQLPPYGQIKCVTCVHGTLLDVAVDLRKDSPTYGQHVMVELSAEKGNMLYVPAGMAHGFYALTDGAIMLANNSAMYAPSHDGGIRWDSCGIQWPDMSPTVSEKDAHLPGLEEFDSPFMMG